MTTSYCLGLSTLHKGMGGAIGYNEFDFCWKIKNTGPLMGAKLKSKTLRFFIFNAVFARLALKFDKSTYMTLKNFLLKKSKKVSKNAEFHADFKSIENFFKKCTKKV
jgi:hypothetical protein